MHDSSAKKCFGMGIGMTKTIKSKIPFIIAATAMIAVVIIILTHFMSKPVYTFINNKVYIYEIKEDKILVQGFTTSSRIKESYVLEIDKNLTIQNKNGSEVTISSLKKGDIIIFEYQGKQNMVFKNGAILNRKPYSIYNLVLSDEDFDFAAWGIRFE